MTRIPEWLSIARSHVGIKELPGRGSNPVILQWAADLDVARIYTDDDEAWCALWMNRVFMAAQIPLAGRGYDLLRAASFLSWGQGLPQPALGAILVFTRPQGAHVGLYEGETADAYYVLGANQSNAVTHVLIDKSRLSGVRWPTGCSLPALATVPVTLAADGRVSLSTNEA